MKKILIILLIFASIISVSAQKRKKAAPMPPYQGVSIGNSAELQAIIKRAVDETITKYAAKGMKPGDLAASIIDMRDPDNLIGANFRGEEKIYPASVVKLFYLVAAHQWLENRKIKDSPEMQRILKDMIVDSSNDATNSLVDILSATGGGAEMAEKEFKVFSYKRNAVNRYFESLGYRDINACQKTFCEDAYGLERQFRGKDGINRNKLTTNATARLMAEIVLNKTVNADRSKQMMALLSRNWEDKGDNDDQARGFTGIALKDLDLKGAKLWSKAGWTSKTRHDVAYIEIPGGLKFILCVFTENQAKERDIIPGVAGAVIKELQKMKN